MSKRVVRIYLKSGHVLHITCDSLKVKTHGITGEMTGYSFSGCGNGKPLFINIPDVVAIVQDLEAERNADANERGEDDGENEHE